MCLLCPWPDCCPPSPCILVIKCQDVVNGKIYFLLVRIKLKHMEVEIRRRETTGVCAHSRLALTARACTMPQHARRSSSSSVLRQSLTPEPTPHQRRSMVLSADLRGARWLMCCVRCAVLTCLQPGAGSSAHNESETIAKYEIMDGAPVRGENIPIRCAHTHTHTCCARA